MRVGSTWYVFYSSSQGAYLGYVAGGACMPDLGKEQPGRTGPTGKNEHGIVNRDGTSTWYI